MSPRRRHDTGLLTARRLLGIGRAPAARLGEGQDRGRGRGRATVIELPTAPAPLGIRDRGPVLVAIVIDESPSEYDVDPWGHRHVAGRRIVELLRTDLAFRGDRVAVLHFAESATPSIRPQDPHTRRGRRRLHRLLRPLGAGRTTDICGALAATVRLVPRRWDGDVVVVMLTDGYDGSMTDELHAAVDQLPPRSVHVLSVGGALPGTWDDVALGSATVVPSAERPDAVEWAVARILYRSLGLSWPELLDAR